MVEYDARRVEAENTKFSRFKALAARPVQQSFDKSKARAPFFQIPNGVLEVERLRQVKSERVQIRNVCNTCSTGRQTLRPVEAMLSGFYQKNISQLGFRLAIILASTIKLRGVI